VKDKANDIVKEGFIKALQTLKSDRNSFENRKMKNRELSNRRKEYGIQQEMILLEKLKSSQSRDVNDISNDKEKNKEKNKKLKLKRRAWGSSIIEDKNEKMKTLSKDETEFKEYINKIKNKNIENRNKNFTNIDIDTFNKSHISPSRREDNDQNNRSLDKEDKIILLKKKKE